MEVHFAVVAAALINIANQSVSKSNYRRRAWRDRAKPVTG